MAKAFWIVTLSSAIKIRFAMFFLDITIAIGGQLRARAIGACLRHVAHDCAVSVSLIRRARQIPVWSSTPTTSACRRPFRGASCGPTARGSSPARRLLGNCADLDGRPGAAWRGARRWASASTWPSSAAGRRRPGGVPSLLAPERRLPDARPGLHRRLGAGADRARPRSSASSTPRWRACATPASPSTTSTPTTTSAFCRWSDAPSRRWRARHGIAGIRSAVERPTLAWATEPRRGLEAGLLTGLGLADPAAARRPAPRPAELGLRRVGAPRRGPHPGDHRAARPGRRTSSSATPARRTTARRRNDRRATSERRDRGADLAPRSGGRSSSAASRSAAGESCFERSRRGRRRRAPATAAPPSPLRRRPKPALAELTVEAIALGMFFGVIFGAATVYLALKAGLTVSASIPIAVLAISRLQAARLVDHPREQHRPDHRLGGRIDRRRRGVHAAGVPVPEPRRRHRRKRRRALLRLLDDPDAGARRRRARRADDDPAAALAHRQGARHPPLPRGDGLRRRC